MPTVPAPPTITSGVVTTSQYAQYTDSITFALNPPHAQVRQTVLQTLTNNTWTAITFTTEDVDTDVDGIGGHDTASNTSRYTARYAGWYRIGGAIGFAANVTGIRGARWAINGVTLDAGGTVMAATSSSFAVVPAAAELVYLAINDYLELQGLQVSGGNLDTAVNSTVQSAMSVTWESK